MSVYLRAKYEVSSIILTSFRREVITPPKKPTQIRVNTTSNNSQNVYYLRHRFINQK